MFVLSVPIFAFVGWAITTLPSVRVSGVRRRRSLGTANSRRDAKLTQPVRSDC